MATVLLLFISCGAGESTKAEKVQEVKIIYPDAFSQGIEAHGGFEAWNNSKSLQFSFVKNALKETHTLDLDNRKVNITHPEWTLGFDGEEVWVSPNKEAYGKGSARFYHNLYYYFFCMPFILSDPGITYETLAQDSLNGRLYTPVKVSFGENVGDAPDDVYIAYFDSETNIMGALLYTVTYYSGTASERYNCLIYDNWTEVNGLKVPGSMKGYKYADGKLGELRYDLQFENITVSNKIADQSIFERPAESEIDSLIQH